MNQQTPSHNNEEAVPPEPRKLTRHGLTIVKRSTKPDAKYMARIRFQGKVHELTLAETAKDSFDIAIRARREIHAGRWAELKAATALRQASQITLTQLFTLYRQFTGPDRPAEATRECNIHAITNMVHQVLGAGLDLNAISLLRINSELVWKWKEQKRKLATEADTDERSMQLLRSANSRLRQARSLFSENEDLRNFYRHHKLTLPDCIEKFCAEPPFADCSKDNYHPPGDEIIGRTFQALERLGQSQRIDELNMFKACWLAIGFGLRKSEIVAARNNWFFNISGVVFCRGDKLAKNNKFPEVRVQLNAWDKLQPLIETADPNGFVLSGSKTDRADTTFRQISTWMRSLGWQTTHHIHEFRAWAGCQIAMAPGNDIREAQTFMRHASFATTEKFYGHHLKIKMAEVKLSIPSVTPRPFTPVVLPTPNAQAS